ncbi:MAG: hypothetical protein ACLUD0_16335 [Eubacterium ramulus]
MFEKFGDNEQAYKDYFDDNRDYFYGGDKVIYWMVDEDAKKLVGFPTMGYPGLLDKAIGCWERGEEADKAKRVLSPVTDAVSFRHTRQEWRWIGTKPIKDRIFFTESGGWFFAVNTRDLSVPGNDCSTRDKRFRVKITVERNEEFLETEAALNSDKNPGIYGNENRRGGKR